MNLPKGMSAIEAHNRAVGERAVRLQRERRDRIRAREEAERAERRPQVSNVISPFQRLVDVNLAEDDAGIAWWAFWKRRR